MPDKNPTPADIAKRKADDATFSDAMSRIKYASKFQNLTGYPRSYTPRMREYLKQRGNYNSNTLARGVEEDRAIERGESSLYNETYDKAKSPSYKRGGKVKKTGLAKLHKGEFVVPKRAFRKGKKAKLYKLLRSK